MLETATLVKLSMQAFCLCATVDSLKALEVLHPTALCFPSSLLCKDEARIAGYIGWTADNYVGLSCVSRDRADMGETFFQHALGS